MIINTLFGPEEIPDKPRTIRMKRIKAVFDTLTIREEVANYLPPSSKYTAPTQLFQLFSFLQHETKEHFITVHVDGKNRILCMEEVSVGSLTEYRSSQGSV